MASLKDTVMHTTDMSRWKHSHNFTADFSTAEKNARRVLILAVVLMVAEIIFGLDFIRWLSLLTACTWELM